MPAALSHLVNEWIRLDKVRSVPCRFLREPHTFIRMRRRGKKSKPSLRRTILLSSKDACCKSRFLQPILLSLDGALTGNELSLGPLVNCFTNSMADNDADYECTQQVYAAGWRPAGLE